MNILDQRVETGYTIPIYIEASWDGGYSIIDYNITIFLKDDIDGEGWVCGVVDSDPDTMRINHGINFKLLGVNTILDKIIVDGITYGSHVGIRWTNTYENCVSFVSRADLNYSNLELAIFKANNGKGEAVDFTLPFDFPNNIDTQTITFDIIQADNQETDYFTDPIIWHLTDLKVDTPELREVVLDLKKEMILEETEGKGFTKGYIGMQDIAQMAKKFYIGLDNKAASVAKVYIGDMNGKARLFFSNEGGSGGTILYPELYLFDSSYDYNIGSWVPVISGCNMDLWKEYYGHCFAYFPQSINGVKNYKSGYYSSW
jgi:hypothetical protein